MDYKETEFEAQKEPENTRNKEIPMSSLNGTQKMAQEGILRAFSEPIEQTGILISKPANEWLEQARNIPIPKMLFGQLWFEGELCILYASSNVGKSVLAVQIADSISRRQRIEPLRIEAEAQPVLYFDFELSAKQFENRYSKEYESHYVFSDNFYRIEINPEAEIPEKSDFNSTINEAIEKEIRQTGANILIVDNITYLKSETEKSKDAIPLMKHLKTLKSKYSLSILALAHTPKRDEARPIYKNDLGGSAMLMNFCDSSFAIGNSGRDKNLRYVKQMKVRSCEHIYDTGNVLIYELQKPDNFLKFTFVEYGDEEYHLISQSAHDRENKKELVLGLSKEGKSYRDIEKETGIPKSTVSRYVQDEQNNNEIPF